MPLGLLLNNKYMASWLRGCISSSKLLTLINVIKILPWVGKKIARCPKKLDTSLLLQLEGEIS